MCVACVARCGGRVAGRRHDHQALNMMTRTSAADYAAARIYMTAVDTGWINDEKPVAVAAAAARKHNFQTPIDEVGPGGGGGASARTSIGRRASVVWGGARASIKRRACVWRRRARRSRVDRLCGGGARVDRASVDLVCGRRRARVDRASSARVCALRGPEGMGRGLGPEGMGEASLFDAARESRRRPDADAARSTRPRACSIRSLRRCAARRPASRPRRRTECS